MNTTPSRRDLMKPVQLLGLAFGSAVFAGVVTLVAMGFFQQRGGDQTQRALVVAAITFGIVFIVVLIGIALMLLVVDPAQVSKEISSPVLRQGEDDPNGMDIPTSGDTKPKG